MFTGDKNKRQVTGVGSALVDMLIHEDDMFLQKTGAVKGGMVYVEKEAIDRAVSLSSTGYSVVAGGSACNTIIGIGRLGAPARFVGKSGSGPLSEFFENTLKAHHVEPFLFKSPLPTGRVLSIVTPDAQRSMLTFLGASAEASPDDISEECFRGSVIVHVEGYLLFNKDLILSVFNAARQAGAYISLDLASFTVVEQSKDFLMELVEKFVDILIANEDESRAFTGYADEREAMKLLSEKSEIAVIKLGERGSLVSKAGETIRVAPKGEAAIVDTTGAGDLWASGFLFGLVNGYPLQKCGEIASICGYEVCRVMGAKIPDEGWRRIRQFIGG